MRSIVLLILFFLCFLPFSSCEDWLKEEPKAIAVETFYNTPNEADAAVGAPIAKIRNAYTQVFPSLMETFADYNYGRGSWRSNSDYQGLNATNIGRTDGVWTNFYQAIRDCNIGINGISGATEMNEQQIASYIGELKFLRAFCYFQLVQFWDAIPLRTENNLGQWEMGKSPASEIYELIVNDLIYAAANAPQTPRLAGTPGRNSSRSLLSQVYLQLGDYSNAKKISDEVINSGEYSLVPVSTSRDFDKIFGPDIITSTEEIFYLKTSRTNNAGLTYAMMMAHPNARIDGKKMHGGGGWYAICTTTENRMIIEWDDNDLRKNFNLLPFNFGDPEFNCLLTKFHDPDASGSSANVAMPLIRYPDILLVNAEADTKLAGKVTAQALEKINMIHRRGYGRNPNIPSDVDFELTDYQSLDSFMDLLIIEQAYETWNEGKRWPFLVRLGVADEWVKKYKGLDIAPRHYLFPIPATEFTYNKGLDVLVDQNPGY